MRARRNRAENSDQPEPRTQRPIGVLVTEVGTEPPTLHVLAHANECLQRFLTAFLDTCLDCSNDFGRQFQRIERNTGLQTKTLETREGGALAIPILLFGEAAVIQHETDPAQEIGAPEFSGLLDSFHARESRIVALYKRNILGAHALAAASLPSAKRHQRDAVLNAVDERQFLRRVVGERDARGN